MIASLVATNRCNNTKPIYISIALVSFLLATSTANAAPEVAISHPDNGTTTVVEHYTDGKIATITATPHGITMQDGIPFSTTNISTIPRYTIQQGTINSGNKRQSTTTITTVPVNTIPVTKQVTQAGVLTTPVNTIAQVLPVTHNNEMPVIAQTTITQSANDQIVIGQPASNQLLTTTLDNLQLTPTFTTPGIVDAKTKIMKILKNSDGREIAVPANHVSPGDVIEYHTVYNNINAQPVDDINAMVSLPNNVQLVSLNSPLPTLATTGGDSYQTIQQVGNTVVVKENYSGLKWNLVDLDANTPQTIIIRAKVQ